MYMYMYYILILILILMLKLELPQVMQPRSEAPNAGVRALYFVPAHVVPPVHVVDSTEQSSTTTGRFLHVRKAFF